jgi:tetratricopeptide (TPR) repeat protein
MKSYIDESLAAVSLNPKLALLEGLPYIEAGTMQMRVKKYSVADTLFTKALGFGENHVALMNRGKNHYRRENYDDALKDLDRAIVLYAENGDYYRWRSIVNSRLKKYEEASNDIEQANKLKPNDKNILKQRKWLASKFTRRGYDSAKVRQSADAIDHFDAALRLNPDDADIFYRKSKALSNQFKYDLALVEIKKAIELDPSNYGYYSFIDWILAKRKDWDQIIGYWDQYIARVTDDSRAYLERGGAYLHKGDIRSAVSNAKIAADMGNPDAKAIYEKYKHRVQ